MWFIPPSSLNLSMHRCNAGTPATGASAFGLVSVKGFSLEPIPAAKTIASISILSVGFQMRLLMVDFHHIHLRIPGAEMFGHGMCGIYRAMPAARAAEANTQRRKASFQIFFDSGIDKAVCAGKKRKNLPILFKEFNYWTVHAGQRLILLITPGIVHCTTVEYEAAAIAGIVSRIPLTI